MNPNPLSVFRLIVPAIEAISDTFSTPFVLELGTREYHTFRCGDPAHQDWIQAGPDGAPQPGRCLDCRNTRATSRGAFWRLSAFARAWGTCRSVRDEDAPWRCAWRGGSSRSAGRRTCKGPCRARRGRVALTPPAWGDCRLDVKRESPVAPARSSSRAGANSGTVSSQ